MTRKRRIRRKKTHRKRFFGGNDGKMCKIKLNDGSNRYLAADIGTKMVDLTDNGTTFLYKNYNFKVLSSSPQSVRSLRLQSAQQSAQLHNAQQSAQLHNAQQSAQRGGFSMDEYLAYNFSTNEFYVVNRVEDMTKTFAVENTNNIVFAFKNGTTKLYIIYENGKFNTSNTDDNDSANKLVVEWI